MERHRAAVFVLFGFLCGIVSIGALGHLHRAAASARAEEPDSRQDASADADQTKRDHEIAQLNVKYAKIYLRINQLNLQKAQSYNERVPGSFSQAEIERLTRLVQISQERLNWVQSHGNQADANKLSAVLAVQAAETTYKKMVATNERLPGAVSPLELEKQRLMLDLTKLSLKKAELVGGGNSQLAGMQWELDQLREDLLNLRSQLDSITARR